VKVGAGESVTLSIVFAWHFGDRNYKHGASTSASICGDR
jgi:hypothetical protein